MPETLIAPTEWKAYSGPKVVLDEAGDGTAPACAVVPAGAVPGSGGTACEPTEIALQPPPSWLLRKLLHPYPTPLVEGAGDGQHCTT